MARPFHCIFLITLLAGCLSWPDAPPQPANLTQTFHLPQLHAIGTAITEARTEKRLPGGVLWLERKGVHFTEAYGMANAVIKPPPSTIPFMTSPRSPRWSPP